MVSDRPPGSCPMPRFVQRRPTRDAALPPPTFLFCIAAACGRSVDKSSHSPQSAGAPRGERVGQGASMRKSADEVVLVHSSDLHVSDEQSPDFYSGLLGLRSVLAAAGG